MTDDGFIPLGNTSFSGCGYVISTTSSGSDSLLCVVLTYPFWPLPSSPSPVLSPQSPSCCRVSGSNGGVWAFVAGAGIGIPMVALPPRARNDGKGADDDAKTRTDERLAWTFSRFRSATRSCEVSFVPSSTSPSENIDQQRHPIAARISWREIRGVYRFVFSSLIVLPDCLS
jgi:hypothetical protein